MMVLSPLFVVIKWLLAANWDQASSGFWPTIRLLVGSIAISALLAFWTAIGKGAWLIRLILLLALVVGAETLHRKTGLYTIPWELAQTAMVATLFCFYAYRLRGWSLQRLPIRDPS
jgi:hypothetical protein